DDLLMPGLSAQVRLPVGEPRQALLVPVRATWMENGGPHVAVVSDDSRLERRRGTALSDPDGKREGEEGLKGGEWGRTGFGKALQALQDGTKVDVERISAPAGPSTGSQNPR